MYVMGTHTLNFNRISTPNSSTTICFTSNKEN